MVRNQLLEQVSTISVFLHALLPTHCFKGTVFSMKIDVLCGSPHGTAFPRNLTNQRVVAYKPPAYHVRDHEKVEDHLG